MYNLFETLATSAGTQSGFTECAASRAMQRLPMAASRSFSNAVCTDDVCFVSHISFPWTVKMSTCISHLLYVINNNFMIN